MVELQQQLTLSQLKFHHNFRFPNLLASLSTAEVNQVRTPGEEKLQEEKSASLPLVPSELKAETTIWKNFCGCPLLLAMTREDSFLPFIPALRSFAVRCCYGNTVNDGAVPFVSACLVHFNAGDMPPTLTSEFEPDPLRFPSVTAVRLSTPRFLPAAGGSVSACKPFYADMAGEVDTFKIVSIVIIISVVTGRQTLSRTARQLVNTAGKFTLILNQS